MKYFRKEYEFPWIFRLDSKLLGEEIAPFQDISITHIALLLLRYNRRKEFMKI